MAKKGKVVKFNGKAKGKANGKGKSAGASPRSASGSRKRTPRPAETRPARTPRHQALPGMEDVKDRRLAELCASIGDVRDQMAQLRADEAGDMQAALKRMRELGITSYRHAGVEMARVPGEEKLRVRTSRDKATAEVIDGEETESGGPGAGEFGGERMDALEGLEAGL